MYWRIMAEYARSSGERWRTSCTSGAGMMQGFSAHRRLRWFGIRHLPGNRGVLDGCGPFLSQMVHAGDIAVFGQHALNVCDMVKRSVLFAPMRLRRHVHKLLIDSLLRKSSCEASAASPP